MTKFIFITGGVVSSLGKGINGSSIGRLLKNRGCKVFMQKFDPYINVDTSNMSPLQHGETFITDDGAETDLDLGHYERFIDENLSHLSSITTGKIYLKVIEKERKGEYNGATVQVIPHVTNVIKEAIYAAAKSSKADIVITEIGGTVGDIESLPFIEAIRQVRREIGFENTIYIHHTLVPYLEASKEIKTKPTQHSVKELRSIGISPDIIVLRSEKAINDNEKEKIALFCDVDREAVIEALDVSCLYEIPLNLARQHIDKIIIKHFGLDLKELDMSEWNELVKKATSLKGEVNVGIVGKYVALKDAYLSISESLYHAGIHHGKNIKIHYIDASNLTDENTKNKLEKLDGILVAGSCGEKAVHGKMHAINYARLNNVPYFGINSGMQVALIEYARNVLGYKKATSREYDEVATMPVIELRSQEKNGHNFVKLGLYQCDIKEGSKAYEAYKCSTIHERHRNRYEFNNSYICIYEESDMVFSGFSSNDNAIEIIELKNHPWFVACQFHPEFISRPTRPHPLFTAFIKACLDAK